MVGQLDGWTIGGIDGETRKEGGWWTNRMTDRRTD